jgi:hypothetical protein
LFEGDISVVNSDIIKILIAVNFMTVDSEAYCGIRQGIIERAGFAQELLYKISGRDIKYIVAFEGVAYIFPVPEHGNISAFIADERRNFISTDKGG